MLPRPSFLVPRSVGLGEGSPWTSWMCTCAWVWDAWCLWRNAWHHPMAGVHSWRLQLTSVADVLSVYFCLARSIQGLLPEDLPTLPPHSCGEDPQNAPPLTRVCKPLPFLKLWALDFCPGLEGDGPRSWWPVCDPSHQCPHCLSARRIPGQKPVLSRCLHQCSASQTSVGFQVQLS